MGNDQSSDSNRMAISAMAHLMKITKRQLLELRDTCLRYASTNDDNKSQISHTTDVLHKEKIKRNDFWTAMEEVGLNSHETDSDVLDNLFTMWDKSGIDEVNIVLFLASLSPLASVLNPQSKLEFAFQMMDINDKGTISHDEMINLFNAINATASYFGDAVVTPSQIDMMCEDILFLAQNSHNNNDSSSKDGKKKNMDTIPYRATDIIKKIVTHPTAVQFTKGHGTMRYGSAKGSSSQH